MEIKLLAFCFCWLMTVACSSPRLLPSTDDIYDLPPEDGGDFLRFLLLSKYGSDSPDYQALDQAPIDEEKQMSFDDDEQPMSFDADEQPMSFDDKEKPVDYDIEEKLLSLDNDEMPYGSDDLSLAEARIGNSIHPFRQAVHKFHEEQPTTAIPAKKEPKPKDQSTTTSAPDLLASMPPVTPDKGQKEFVMLRPPSDNHRKIEHWMEQIANDMGLPTHTVHKRQWAM